MSKCTQRQLEHLKLISKSKKKSDILKNCSNDTIKSLCECVLNTIFGNVPLTKNQKNRLLPYKKSLRKLANKRVPLYKKRQLLIQRGDGILTVLLPAAISVISTLLHGVR